jgi:3-phenylpropionate/trans-cinnamate dioxygenase ferredoxin reductase subunit
MSDPERIVIVGASLAGLRAAETLRTDGFSGSVVLVGDEPHRPYDRPPLSKQVLTGAWPPERTALPGGAVDALDVAWDLGTRATGLDLAARQVRLADDRLLAYDGLVIATGAAPRRLPGTDGLHSLHGVVTLRTLDDAVDLSRWFDEGVERVVVVGAGFIGAEVAASCRQRGVAVTMVEPLAQPLARVLGEVVGAVIAKLHVEHDVDLRLGVGVAAVEGDGRVERVVLADGSSVAADVVVVGIGVTPNTGWLEGSGLTLDDGVACDETTLAARGVVAAGDVARWPNPRYGETMRVEHWEHAIDMGAHAARRLLAGDGPGEAFAPVPWFWSDQYDRKLQLAGHARPTDELAVVAGSLQDRRFCALYGRDGRVTAALGMNMPAKVVRYRRALAEGLGWDDALEDATS